jgi:hypothetical protein
MSTFDFTLSSTFDYPGESFGSFLSVMDGPEPFGNFTSPAILATVAAGDYFPGGGSAAYNGIFVLQGGTWNQQAGLNAAAAGTASSTAGLALDGNTAIIGYPTSNGLAIGFGAFIFTRNPQTNTWSVTADLSTGDAQSGDDFGNSAALSGSWAAIGAFQTALHPGGAVYIYQGPSWTLTQTLVPSDLSAGDQFGGANNNMVMTGEWLFIPAVNQATNKGAVYVFQLQGSTWVQVQKLTGSVANDQFGYAISCDGVTLAIGAVQDPSHSPIGGGYVKTFTLISGSWTLQQKLTDPASFAGDQFGSGVSVSNSLLVVGSLGFNSNAGAVYVYQFETGPTWTLVQTIAAPVGVSFFGQTVAARNSPSGAYLFASAVIAGTGPAYVYAFASPGSGIYTSQIAFKGVRRNAGSLPNLSACQTFKPETYTYVLTGTLEPGQVKGYLAGQAPVQLFQTINDFDFELHQMIVTYSAPVGVSLPSVCSALMLYDAVKQATANIPPMDKFWNGGPLSEYQDGSAVPPLVYPQQTQIRVDVFNLLPDGLLPVTITVHLVGKNRKPC